MTNCAYREKKHIDKKIIALCTVVIIFIACILFWKLNHVSVIGEWKIDHYITEDGNVSQDDIGEYYGVVYQTANSAFSVVFERDGKATLYLPTYEGTETTTVECDYEVDGENIYLSVDGDRIRAFEIKGDTLIVYGVLTFNGDAVLKKQ